LGRPARRFTSISSCSASTRTLCRSSVGSAPRSRRDLRTRDLHRSCRGNRDPHPRLEQDVACSKQVRSSDAAGDGRGVRPRRSPPGTDSSRPRSLACAGERSTSAVVSGAPCNTPASMPTTTCSTSASASARRRSPNLALFIVRANLGERRHEIFQPRQPLAG
jgi:hypothetical protein